MSELITIYALLPANPTEALGISFITDTDAGTVTLHAGVVGGVSEASTQVSGTQIPSRTEYIYHATIAGLKPGTQYRLWVDGLFAHDSVPSVKTLPDALPRAGFKIMVLADTHTGAGAASMNAPAEMNIIRDENAEMMWVVGDLASQLSETYGSDNGNDWIISLRDYISVVNTNGLVPILLLAGNHEVGNHEWDGTGAVNPDGTYYRVFFPNISDMQPAGENYAAPVLGDWCQIVAVDSHSATTANSRTWIHGNAVDANVPVVIPGQHSPLCSANVRVANDMVLQENLRNAVFRKYHESENIRFGFTGHIHTRTRTKPMVIVASDPGGNRFPLLDGNDQPDGYMVDAVVGYVEIGQGYRSDRTGSLLWFLEESGNNEKNYNVVELEWGKVKVSTRDTNGVDFWSREWSVDYPVKQPHISSTHGTSKVSGVSRTAVRRVSGGAWQ